MSKRSVEEEDTSRPPKRYKVEHVPPANIQSIEYARQLQDILDFSQAGIQHVRDGIASFRAFLDSILYHKDERNRGRNLSILREYLESQKPVDIKDPDKPFLSPLWQAWSFAVQNQNDHIVSSVAAILALLLKTLGSILEFREFGVLLCRTVLLHQHLRWIKRGLDAPPHKDFVLSPCLRLLTETTNFDGGIFAKEVYKRREYTFDIPTTRRNLGLVKQDIPEEELRRKPSIRTLTARFVLALLKFLHEGAKTDILKSRPLCGSLFHLLRLDPPDLVREILTTTEQHILKVKEVPRSAKANLLGHQTLSRVTEIATRASEEDGAADAAFAWLFNAISNPSYGILRASAWYPPGTETLETGSKDGRIDLGLNSIDFYDADERANIRNTTLLSWIETLRPHSELQHRKLVLQSFRSAPELVSAYFHDKSVQMDPSLTNTWIGYASFLFEVIRLPEPTKLGHVDGDDFAELPPQTNIMIENILPRVWSQKVLTKCLNQSSELITLFAVRVLVLALQKTERILGEMKRAAERPQCRTDLWQEAKDRLIMLLTSRCPSMKDVIATFRKTAADEEHSIQREAISRLLSLYYRVLDVAAGEEIFDISSALTNALEQAHDDKASTLRSLDLEHLLDIARSAPGMRWFTKQGSLSFSPIVSILRIYSANSGQHTMRDLIHHVLQLHSMCGSARSTDGFLASLRNVEDAHGIWSFLDECLARASRAPVKYLDDLDNTANGSAEGSHAEAQPSLLAAVVVEQLSFASSKPHVVDWVHRYLAILQQLGEHTAVIRDLRKKAKHVQAPSRRNTSADIEDLLTKQASEAKTDIGSAQETILPTEDVLPFQPPPMETENHPELLRWSRKDLGLAIEEGDVGALMLCLSSQHEDIRIQAVAQLKLLRTALQASSLDDKDALSLLVGELVETFEQGSAHEALPYLATTFASRSLHVLQDPTHHIYPKLNRFLIRSPDWNIARLPSYWFANTALVQPSEDDGYWREVQWVLEWLVDGLRVEADLDILRKGDMLQKTTALHDSPAASAKLVKERLYELLYRAAYVKSGSNTLITRAGVLAWLEMQSSSPSPTARALRKHVLASCDSTRMESWSAVPVDTM